jgi:hypothetical protein
MARIHRRNFFEITVGLVSAVGGSFITEGRLNANNFEAGPFGNVAKTLGPERLNAESATILHQFATAGSGQLMALYQTFWPFALNEGSLTSLASASAASVQLPQYAGRQHRISVLPGVASIHALSSLGTAAQRDAATETILNIHQNAFETEPHREILQMLWQNVVAALIRNEENWNTLHLDQRLLLQGSQLCEQFLQGEEILFTPATQAFHGLLTYRKALIARRDNSSLRHVDRLIYEVLELESAGRSPWFARLASIVERFDMRHHMLPQLSELIMGYEHFPKSVADFAIAVKLYSQFLIEEAATGNLTSIYQTQERAQSASGLLLTFLTDYGVTPEFWAAFDTAAKNLLLPNVVKHFDAIFADYAGTIRPLTVAYGEGEAVKRRLSALIPFRLFDERTIVRAAYAPEGENSVASRALNYGSGLFGLLKTCELGIGEVTGLHNQKLHISLIHDMLDTEEFAPVLKKPLEYYEEALDDLRPIHGTNARASSDRSTVGTTLDAPLEEPAMTADEERELQASRDFLEKELARLGYVETGEEITDDELANIDLLMEGTDFSELEVFIPSKG